LPPLTPALLRLDPMFDPLRNDPLSKNFARKSRNNFTTDRTDNTDGWIRPELGLNQSRSRHAESGFASVIREHFS
jgi:hypothetical protein